MVSVNSEVFRKYLELLDALEADLEWYCQMIPYDTKKDPDYASTCTFRYRAISILIPSGKEVVLHI